MARFKGRAPEGVAVPAERQLNLVDWLDGFARRSEEPDPARPALGIFLVVLALLGLGLVLQVNQDRKSTRLNSSHSSISYAVFCLKKKKNRMIVVVVIERSSV